MDDKWCPACGTRKAVEEFHRSRARYDGRNQYCAPCSNARLRLYRAVHPEKAREYNARRRPPRGA